MLGIRSWLFFIKFRFKKRKGPLGRATKKAKTRCTQQTRTYAAFSFSADNEASQAAKTRIEAEERAVLSARVFQRRIDREEEEDQFFIVT